VLVCALLACVAGSCYSLLAASNPATDSFLPRHCCCSPSPLLLLLPPCPTHCHHHHTPTTTHTSTTVTPPAQTPSLACVEMMQCIAQGLPTASESAVGIC
jgi:hypothetical protein